MPRSESRTDPRARVRPLAHPEQRERGEVRVTDGRDPEDADSEQQVPGAARERCGDRRSGRDPEYGRGEQVAGLFYPGRGRHAPAEGAKPYNGTVDGKRLHQGHIDAEQPKGDPGLRGAQEPAAEMKCEARPQPAAVAKDALETR